MMIDCQQLSYSYPLATKQTLRNITVKIDDGEFVVVSGASGAGKSTWLRCLNGLVPHFSGGTIRGSLVVNGQNLFDTPPHQLARHVGFVFQSPETQSILDEVEAEIAFGMECAGIPSAEMHRRMEQLLDLLQIKALRHRSIDTLSGGERQRVAIATALALRPALLVLDEPTSQLDEESAESLLHHLAYLHKEHHLTIIVAEHRLERLLPYATRHLHFEAGQLTTPPQLIAIPKAVKAARPQTVRLTIDDLHYDYGNRPILQGVDLTLHSHEIIALHGKNGAGKTTLLRCVLNLQKRKQGDITLNGVSLKEETTAQIGRKIAYLPQNPDDLLFAESVADELAISLANHGLTDSPPISPKEMLETLGIGELAESYPRDLSVGQRQRVALALLLITNPDILLLDEPTRGLDAATKERFGRLLLAWRDQGKGILLVTHDRTLIKQVADRVVELRNGRIDNRFWD